MAALSLNQIVNRIRSLSLAHHQINSFYFGDVPEFDANGDISYPGCFLELLPGSIDRTAKQKRFNFRIYFLDLVKVSDQTEENETEVLSDMDQVAGDMLALLNKPEYEFDWTIVENSAINPVTESLGDMVAGVFIEVGILVEYFADSCQVPSDDVDFINDLDMARTRIHNYTATGSEGFSFSVPEISGKHILAIWRAGSYKRAVAVTPTDTEKIQVGTVDLGSGKGILGNGTVTLESDDALIPTEKLDILYYA